MEATGGFEPPNRGFADPRLRPLGYVAPQANLVPRRRFSNEGSRLHLPSRFLPNRSCQKGVVSTRGTEFSRPSKIGLEWSRAYTAIRIVLPAVDPSKPVAKEMVVDYQRLFSSSLPATVDMPPGLTADTKYVFSVTYADPHTSPYEGLSAALREALRRDGPDLARYPPPQGHEAMRELIAQNLREKRGLETTPDAIFLSAGAGGAIQRLLDVFIDPGDIVLAEEFTYLGTLRILLERRADVVHVATDQQGMNTEELESTVRRLVAQGKRPKMLYTIPIYQNPLGMNLSLERRRHMLEVSHRYGIPVLENESYADFRIDGDPLPRSMMGLDEQHSVMYVSAFTKLLGCGLRLGYAVVPDAVRETLANVGFGSSPSHLSAMAVYEYLRHHREEHIEHVGASLRAKRDAMLAALGEHFPPGCTWSKPTGGMMIWVRLPEGADTWSTLEKAVEADVKYNPGPVFRAARDRPNYLRLTYSYNTPEEIRDGVAILADVFQREGLFDGR